MFRIGQVIAQLSKSPNSELKLARFLALSSVRSKEVEKGCPPPPKTEKKNEEKQNFSFMANIFRGAVETSQLFPYPDVLNDDQKETLAMYVDPVTRYFTDVNNAAKNDDNANLDKEIMDSLWELGAFGLQVPLEYGGLGANNSQYARIAEIVGASDLGLSICLGAHQSIGFKGILLFGTKAQKEKYLPQVSTGKKVACFCLTEPSSGSDAGSIKTRAVLSDDGKHFIMNGTKIWISNGGIAEIFTVFAQTEIEDPETGKKRDKVTAFIVERGFGGVKSGPPEKKMGIKCSNTTEVYFEDCKIPIENVLGAVGDGFKVAMNILNNGRFGMSGTLAGTMATCIRHAAEHVGNRVQFGKKLHEFEGIQEKLARMAMLQYVSQSMAYMIAGNMDSGSQDYHLEAAISKVFASEAAWNVCDESIQILGGMGYMKETGLERILRDLRIFRIFEGTNDILRLFVALTGIQYAGLHLKELQRAFQDPTANLGLIFSEFSTRATRAARSVGLAQSDLSRFVDPSLAASAKLCADGIDLFGTTVESLLVKHGKKIVDQQFLLNRLADCAIDIYAMGVVLSRASRSIKLKFTTAEYETLLVQAWCIEAFDRVQVNARKIQNNKYVDVYPKLSAISKNVVDNQGVVTINPYNV